MPQHGELWAVLDSEQNIYVWTLRSTMKESVEEYERVSGGTWEEKQSIGFTCREVRIGPVYKTETDAKWTCTPQDINAFREATKRVTEQAGLTEDEMEKGAYTERVSPILDAMHGRTWQEVFDTISGAFALSNFPKQMTPNQVYRAHPDGESFSVVEMYGIALMVLKSIGKTEEDARKAALPFEVEE